MKQVKRVTSKEFEDIAEDKLTEGYKLKSKTDRQAIFVKPSYGGVLGHAIVFVFTFWFTLGLGNVGYAGYCYLVKSDEIQLKLKK